jgi:hypothetical protein
MRATIHICSLIIMLSLCSNGAAQEKPSSEAQSQPAPTPESSASSGVKSHAPPQVASAIVLPSACLEVPLAVFQTSGGDRTPGKQFTGAAEVHVTISLNKEQNEWLVRCGLPDGEWKNESLEKAYGGNLDATRVTVWTAKDSEDQRTFVLSEVQMAIERAINNNIVKNAVFQAAAEKAFKENEFVKTQVSEMVNKAVKQAIEQKSQEIEDAAKKKLQPEKSTKGSTPVKSAPPQPH